MGNSCSTNAGKNSTEAPAAAARPVPLTMSELNAQRRRNAEAAKTAAKSAREAASAAREVARKLWQEELIRNAREEKQIKPKQDIEASINAYSQSLEERRARKKEYVAMETIPENKTVTSWKERSRPAGIINNR